ncbi:hypothetical protein Ancab_035025 [Ancistrocladus abbreviatus]
MERTVHMEGRDPCTAIILGVFDSCDLDGGSEKQGAATNAINALPAFPSTALKNPKREHRGHKTLEELKGGDRSGSISLSQWVDIDSVPKVNPTDSVSRGSIEAMHQDELNQEFDTFLTSRPHDVVRIRYARLRSVAGRIQTVFGDIAIQGERIQSLQSWRDPRATSLSTAFCLCAVVVLYVRPFRALALVAGLYTLHHPGSATSCLWFRAILSRDCQLKQTACFDHIHAVYMAGNVIFLLFTFAGTQS